jgi:anti-sigma factor RsiW
MNTPHTVSPEKVMAFLDGELSAAEAKMVSDHVEHCGHCARVSEQLRVTSRVLSHWTVSPASKELDIRVQEILEKSNSGLIGGRAGLRSDRSFWNNRWVYVAAGSVAAVVLFVALFGPGKEAVSPLRRTSAIVAYNGAAGTDGQGSVWKLTPRPPVSNARSKNFEARESKSIIQGGVSDSNGVFDSRGNRAAQSFSADGQLVGDKLDENSQAPMIALTVSLSMVVKDFAASRTSLDAVLGRRHGYSAQLNVYTPENGPRSLQASLRVPAPELSSAVSDLKGLGRVENESQSGEEVTRQHTDLVNRLKTARETEQRFRGILQQRTGNLAEVLQVEEGIARVRGDIERMEADEKALEHRVDFATIDLQLTEEYKAPLNSPAASVSTRIHNAFVAGYHNASETVLGILLFLEEYGPTLFIWLVILVLPVVFLWRRYRKSMETA